MFGNFFYGKRVLITGHTGFKGSWLAEWLLKLGATVHGVALDPPPGPSLFAQLQLGSRLARDNRADIRDGRAVAKAVSGGRPDIIFHLAAQPLVRKSYQEPTDTFATNVMGTVNVLEAARTRGRRCDIVCVTTDKCYENQEWVHAYRECDPLGGHDPYSASKAAAELVASSYRRSFFAEGDPVRLASARAGNVLGGGDYAEDRIVPDVVRALDSNSTVVLRNALATRPWQHVLEPLAGYLCLAAALPGNAAAASAFNFGPGLSGNRTVEDLVDTLLRHTGGNWVSKSDPDGPHEAARLNLSIDKAYHLLGWQPVWSFEHAVERTASWYMRCHRGTDDPIALTQCQIDDYMQAACKLNVPWAVR